MINSSITVGKEANYNIYSENLFEVPEMQFKDALPSVVVFGGNVITEK